MVYNNDYLNRLQKFIEYKYRNDKVLCNAKLVYIKLLRSLYVQTINACNIRKIRVKHLAKLLFYYDNLHNVNKD